MTYSLVSGCNRHGIEADGPSHRFSTLLSESYHYACKRIEQLETIVATLPKLADDATAYPGMTVYRMYLGSLWEARVLSVGDGCFDIQYTNDGSHRAKSCVSRGRRTSEWYSTKEAAVAAGGSD